MKDPFDQADDSHGEAILREAEEKFRTIFQAAAIGVAVVDLEQVIVDANPTLCKMLRYGAAELKGSRWDAIISPYDAESFNAAYLQLLAGLLDSHRSEVGFRRKDGSLRRGHLTLSVVRAPNLSPSSIVALLEDVTERRQIEDRLRLAEKEVNTLLDSIPAYAYLKDTGGRFITANKRFCDAYGVTKSEIVGKTIYDITRPSLADKSAEDDAKVISTGQPLHEEGKFADRGRALVVESTVLPLKGEGRRVVGIIGLIYDVTERKRDEAALADSERRYRTLFDESPMPLVVEDFSEVKVELASLAEMGIQALRKHLLSNPDVVRRMIGKVKVVDVNSAFMRLFEASDRQELNSLYQILSEEAVGGFVERLIAIAEGRSEFETETVNRSLKGNRINVVVKYIMPRESANSYRIIVSVTDITQMKDDEAALRASEAKYRELVENARSAILKQDLNGKILSCNEFAEELFGFTADELVGRSVLETLVPLTESTGRDLRTLIADIYAHPEAHANSVNENVKKNGTRVWMHWSNSIAEDLDGSPVILSVGTDITNRKLMEEDLKMYSTKLETMVRMRTRELNRSHRQLLKAERLAAIGSVAAQVSHDLRSPLASLGTNLFYIRNTLPPKERRRLEPVLDSMEKDMGHAKSIISDLLNFSTRPELRTKTIYLGEVIAGAIEHLSVPAGVEIQIDAFPKAPIRGDPTYLIRVFQNLIFNAIDAMPKGGKVSISVMAQSGEALVSVADQGVGITKENMGRLFTPFFTTKPKGTGLGLAICKRLVEAHRGRIWVESEPGKGTTFFVTFPLVGPAARSHKTRARSQPPAK